MEAHFLAHHFSTISEQDKERDFYQLLCTNQWGRDGETELRKADRTVEVNCNILSNISSGSLKKLGRAWRNIGKYITVHPNRRVSLSEFSFFKLAFAFADQNPPGSGTFDLSVGPF